MPMKREKIYKFDDFQRNTGLYSRNSSLVKSIKTEKRCGLSISKTQIKLTLFLILLVLQIVFGGGNLFANNPDKLKKTGFHSTQTTNRHLTFKTDSTKSYSFNERNKKQGLKPYIAPTLLISAGTALHFSTNTKENFQDWVQSNFAYSGSADDYLRYAPLAAVYSLNLFGVKGKNNFGNRTALALKSLLLNDLIVSGLKRWSNETRPNGDAHSFPSGHTSVAFAMAHFMHKEYGDLSVWYSIGAYSCATAVGVMRVAKNAHWISDVVAGAGIGILSTELVYLTHLYKWDCNHIKNFDIFPFKVGKQKGITMVYNF